MKFKRYLTENQLQDRQLGSLSAFVLACLLAGKLAILHAYQLACLLAVGNFEHRT